MRAFLVLVAVLLSGCETREEATAHFAPAVEFSYSPKTVALPSESSYADKRGFADFNGDGIEDMFEIDSNFSGSLLKIQVFPSQMVNGIVTFQSPTLYAKKMDLPWFSSATKIDTGDLNGDGYADVVITQYIEKIGEDVLHMEVFLNDQATGFTRYTDRLHMGNQSLTKFILIFIDGYASGYEESLYDYLKMDWADLDGNGSDDLLLAWDDDPYLYLEVFYTRVTRESMITFDRNEDYEIRGFTRGRSIRQFDVEDVSGDGMADLIIRRVFMGKASIMVAMNTGNGFTPHKDLSLQTTDMNFIRFEKVDTFDVNDDNKADFVHLGVMGGQKTMSYNLCRHGQ